MFSAVSNATLPIKKDLPNAAFLIGLGTKTSPFIYLGWGSILLYLVSVLGYRKLS